MATIEYSLFRARIIKPRQGSLLADKDLTSGEIFLRALNEKPFGELRQGYTWHIGNIKLFSKNTGYFAVGRTTISTIEKFDDLTGNFVEEEQEESPYTHCVFDAHIGFIGIARKPSLAPTTKGIANRIADLLSSAIVITENDISVEIAPIPNPEGFISALESAYRVTRYTATFHGPNPFDADEYFQKPLSVYLSATNGEKGKAEVKGTDLNRETLQAVTRSTAATGNEASARITKTRSHKQTTINLKGDAAKLSFDDASHDPETALKDLTSLYHQVRNDN
jgi:hypothetical protein